MLKSEIYWLKWKPDKPMKLAHLDREYSLGKKNKGKYVHKS